FCFCFSADLCRLLSSPTRRSSDLVASELLARQITPLTIEAEQVQGGADVLAVLRQKLRRKRVDLDELIIYTRQMYSLTKAGVPIIRAIGGLAESNRNLYFREVLQDVDRKSTRLNSSHVKISYAVFCLKKKNK